MGVFINEATRLKETTMAEVASIRGRCARARARARARAIVDEAGCHDPGFVQN